MPIHLLVKFYLSMNRDNEFVGMIRRVSKVQPLAAGGDLATWNLSRSLLFFTTENGTILDTSRAFTHVHEIPSADAVLNSSEVLRVQDLAEELSPQRLWSSESTQKAVTLHVVDKEISFDRMRAKIDNTSECKTSPSRPLTAQVAVTRVRTSQHSRDQKYFRYLINYK